MSRAVDAGLILVMGVSGCGKSTLGRALAERLGWDFIDADDHHTESNIRTMMSGVALTDDDRSPWLSAVRGAAERRWNAGRPVVLACSALKRRYRTMLIGAGAPRTLVVHLSGDIGLIRSRMQERAHFMPPALLESQFADLEPPMPGEPGVAWLQTLDAALATREQVARVLNTPAWVGS